MAPSEQKRAVVPAACPGYGQLTRPPDADNRPNQTFNVPLPPPKSAHLSAWKLLSSFLCCVSWFQPRRRLLTPISLFAGPNLMLEPCGRGRAVGRWEDSTARGDLYRGKSHHIQTPWLCRVTIRLTGLPYQEVSATPVTTGKHASGFQQFLLLTCTNPSAICLHLIHLGRYPDISHFIPAC